MAKGFCLWCGHKKNQHYGAPQATIDKFEKEWKEGKFAVRVVWTPTACSRRDCKGCRRYEP